MNKNELISENAFEEVAINNYKKHIQRLQEKEKFLEDMPYSDDYPR